MCASTVNTLYGIFRCFAWLVPQSPAQVDAAQTMVGISMPLHYWCWLIESTRATLIICARRCGTNKYVIHWLRDCDTPSTASSLRVFGNTKMLTTGWFIVTFVVDVEQYYAFSRIHQSIRHEGFERIRVLFMLNIRTQTLESEFDNAGDAYLTLSSCRRR